MQVTTKESAEWRPGELTERVTLWRDKQLVDGVGNEQTQRRREGSQ
jgi:hypothetical protein